jgi:hypothetical protein
MSVLGSVRCRTRFAASLCGLLFGLLYAALPCAADTIVKIGAGANGPAVNAAQFESQGWTQTQNYADVSISVSLLSWTPGATFNITAYLTDGTGPAGPWSTLDTTSFSAETPDSSAENFLLFSGLTLGPGAYYLTLSSTDNAGGEPGALWPTECFVNCSSTLAPGIVLLSQGFVNESFGVENIEYPPDSTFMTSSPALNLTVTGIDPPDPSVPEPATLPAVIIGMAGLLIATKLRIRHG